MKCGVVSLIMLMLSTGLFAGEENIIPLPEPEKTGGMPLMEALNQRHSGRSFQDKALTDQILSNLLWAAFGVNRENGKRTAPSSQGKTEMEIYVAKSDGLFLYLPEKNALKKILDEDIRAKTGKQNFVADAPVNLIFVANYKKPGMWIRRNTGILQA